MVNWKEGRGNHLYVEDECKGNFNVPQYVDTLCKIRKGIELSCNFLYQEFSNEDYSQLLFNEGIEYQVHEIYLKITRSHLHKVVSRLAIFPYAKVVAFLVQKANVTKKYLRDT